MVTQVDFSEKVRKFLRENGYFIEGVWYPRVTAICQVKSKPGLYKFYGEAESFEMANKKKAKAASEGTIIHELIESFITKREILVPEEYIGIKKAFESFLKEHSFFSHKDWIEKKVKHPNHRYAGTLDLLGEVDGAFSLIDIKTSAKVYEDYRLQTAAYFYALNEEPWMRDYNGRKIILPREIEKRFILRIAQKRICEKCGGTLYLRNMGDKFVGGEAFCDHKFGEIEGEWELVEFDNVKEDFEGFLHCKGLWEWDNREILKNIGYF
jgi:hypothetical protein